MQHASRDIRHKAITPSDWTTLPVGCHWISPRYPSAIVSTISDPKHPEARYVAVVNFAHIGLFATRELAQKAIEAHLGD